MSVRADPFPVTKYCRLIFGSTYTLSVGAAGVLGTERVFNLNSIHQPESGAGHQPYGHDQLALLYKQYKVLGVKIDLVFSDPTDDSVACVARLVPPNVVAGLTGNNPTYMAEAPFTIMKMLNDSGSQKTYFSQYVPMSRVLGITPLQFKTHVGTPYSALFGTNPTDLPTLRVAAASVRSIDTSTVILRVRLTYYTMCYERHFVGSS